MSTAIGHTEARTREAANSPAVDTRSEWLETDGLGGFASGTVAGPRTRRYHALLLAASEPPGGRFVLVNGLETWVTTPAGTFPLSAQIYAPGVTHPRGDQAVESFEPEPWPAWTYRLADGTRIRAEVFARHGVPAIVLRWKLLGKQKGDVTLHARPLLSGRDPHALHGENGAFRFDAEAGPNAVTWRPYDGVPPVRAITNADYAHGPDWFRDFLYEEERGRGLDDVESLASPGTFTWDLGAGEAVMVFATDVAGAPGPDGTQPAGALAASWARAERTRRRRMTPLERAGDAYLVKRGEGLTVIAGYPWFGDWGRDTFIALRGLCIATGRLREASRILTQWAGAVSEGMMPNRFPDRGDMPEYNSVDASLWYVIAVHELLEAGKRVVRRTDRAAMLGAVEAILTGYSRGTRYGIRMDDDGLLACGEPGVQLTWMDAKVGDWVVTPRIGKPVEVQALWINALEIGAMHDARWKAPLAKARAAFAKRFRDAGRGALYDVIDVDHVRDSVDASCRPNQIFAVGGLPFPLLEGERARAVIDEVERRLWTPLGPRSLAPGEAAYTPRYEGGVRERDGAYHQGTVWPWLAGPFIEAWVRVRGGGAKAKAEARRAFLDGLRGHLNAAGVGHVSEIADADAPHAPRGCPFQAWSVGELLRLEKSVLA